jgi:O-antigen ligase
VRAKAIPDWLRNPWPPLVAALVVVSLAVGRAPMLTGIVVSAVAICSVLVWRYGAREGFWYLLLITIPLRQPLAVDLHGTVSLYLTDVLLFALFADVVVRGGLERVWRSSTVLKIGAAILLISLPGLLTATRFFWGVASVYRIAMQIALFVVAADVVRSGRQATRTLAAILVGLAAPVVYGLYQASLPFGSNLPDWASQQAAWDLAGHKVLRVYSTFDHTLRFSHYLSIGFGLALGLAFSNLRRLWKGLLLTIGAAAAYCNLFTYSLGGVVGMMSAVVATLVLSRRRALALLPLLVVPIILLSPAALVRRADRVLSGEATTVVARMVTYRQSLMIMRDHPLLGAGWGSIRSLLENRYLLTRSNVVAFGAENYFLQRGTALGLTGLALYVALCVLFFVNVVRRTPRREGTWPRAALLVGGVALYVQAQTFPATNAVSNYALWIMFALAENMARAAREALPMAAQTAPGDSQS